MSHMTPRPADHHAYELTIRRLFEAPVVDHPEQEIVYRGQVRLTYRQFRERVHRRAGVFQPAAGSDDVFVAGLLLVRHVVSSRRLGGRAGWFTGR